MKNVFRTILLSLLICSVAVAHSGRTDKYGGHYNRKTGEYHFHNSGTVPRGPINNTPQLPISPANLSEHDKAILDAHQHVKMDINGASWFLAGAGCGVFGFAYAALSTPVVPPHRLIGRTPTYVATYTTEYRKLTREKRLTQSCLGWGAFSVVYLLLVAGSS